MACIAGRKSKIQISSDNITFYNLGKMVDASLDTDIDELECTSHDSADREFIRNFRSSTMSLTLRWCETDAGQGIVWDNVFGALESFYIQFDIPGATPGSTRFTMEGFVQTDSIQTNLDDLAAVDMTLRVSNVVKTVQP